MIETIREIFSRAAEQLLGRLSGPMHLRFVMTPAMASYLAIRAGLLDARQGQKPFMWELLSQPEERKAILQSAWKSIRKVILVAIILDTVYQLYFFRAFYVVQTLILVALLAVIPYILIRGMTTRLAR